MHEEIQELLAHIRRHSSYLRYNAELLDIFEGNLEEYVKKDLQSSLSPNYYQKIESRIIPINILKRFIDKLSKAYSESPIRKVVTKNASDEKLLDYYEKQMRMNINGNYADEYAHLFKGYAWEPFVDEQVPGLRTLPYDRFLPYSNNKQDPKKITHFVKCMGKRPIEVADRRQTSGYRIEMRDVYYVYTKDKFFAFDSYGDVYTDALVENEGENPFGIIPFMYGNRSRDKAVPTQDTDILRMTKVIPVMLSDVSGTILFQCFSVIWGVDINAENLTMSPNAFWNLKSDTGAQHKPQVGTLKPEADIDKVKNFIIEVFVFWLETKGIKVGSIGSVDSANVANGISKILDEADTTDLRKMAIQFLTEDEKEFWERLKIIHNYWVSSGQVVGMPMFSDQFEVEIEFDEPKPVIDREKELRIIDKEVEKGYLPPRSAIMALYPKLSEKEIEERVKYYEEVKGRNAAAKGEDTNTQGIQATRAPSDSEGSN